MSSIAEHYALHPSDFGPVVSQEFSQLLVAETVDGVVEHELRRVLAKHPGLSGDRLILHFKGQPL